MRNKLQLRLGGLLLSAISFCACAGNEKDTIDTGYPASSLEATSTGDSPRSLPERWDSLSHAEWLEALDISDCQVDNQASESRKVNWVQLEGSTQLLLIACAFGAYQDAFHLYTVDADLNSIESVVLQSSLQDNDLIRGIVYKGDEDKVVELLQLSSATGACGRRSLYPIDEVKQGGVIEPIVTFGDDDCYNRVTVEDGPALD